LTRQDNLSKYLIAEPLRNQIEEVSEALTHRVFLVYGIPAVILTDQGSNFMSEVFKGICKLFGIEKLNTLAYLSGSNGALEIAQNADNLSEKLC
jgi:transposase InsO family protein